MTESSNVQFDNIMKSKHEGYSILYDTIENKHIEFGYIDNTDLDSYVSKAIELRNAGNHNVRIVEHILITKNLMNF